MRASQRLRLGFRMVLGLFILGALVLPPRLAAAVTLAECTSLTAVADPATNRTSIQACLNDPAIKQARLRNTNGPFLVDAGLTVPDGATLLGDTTWPTIQAYTAGGGATFSASLITVASNTRVGFLTLDANNRFAAGCCYSIVSVTGNATFVDNNVIMNAKVNRGIGVYVICEHCTGNTIYNNQIQNNFLGAIFRSTLTANDANTLDHNAIFENKCDGVTFAGYGRATNNTIYQNGYDCQNGPIPGAAIYSAGNLNGAVISGNTIYDNCGNNIDLDGVSGFQISANTVTDPGYQWGGSRTYCKGAVSLLMVDVSASVVEANIIRNDNRPWNKMGNQPAWANWFRAEGAAGYSDLPHGAQQTISFLLAQRPGTLGRSINNTITGNTLVSYCPLSLGCVGMGYFTTRGTGVCSTSGACDPAWHNRFTTNNPNGSQVGSRRGGNNYYASTASTTASCSTSGAPAPCNWDDNQHNPPSGDATRNDKFYTY